MENNKETLQKLVIKEATRLKKHATKEELSKLDFDTLHPDHWQRCIYGQMTGDCFSQRAYELILECAPRVYVAPLSDSTSCGLEPDGKLNGKPHSIKHHSVRGDYYFSPIERFIYLPGNKGKTKKLISFLKGKTTKLEF